MTLARLLPAVRLLSTSDKLTSIGDRIQGIRFSALGAFWNIYELKVDESMLLKNL